MNEKEQLAYRILGLLKINFDLMSVDKKMFRNYLAYDIKLINPQTHLDRYVINIKFYKSYFIDNNMNDTKFKKYFNEYIKKKITTNKEFDQSILPIIFYLL